METSLRERKSDIPLLVSSFLDKFSEAEGQARTIVIPWSAINQVTWQ